MQDATVINNPDGSQSVQIPDYRVYTMAELQARLSNDQAALASAQAQASAIQSRVDGWNALIAMLPPQQ